MKLKKQWNIEQNKKVNEHINKTKSQKNWLRFGTHEPPYSTIQELKFCRTTDTSDLNPSVSKCF